MQTLFNSILILSLSFFFSWHCSAQFTAIPDTAFEAKLIQLGIDSDGLVNGQMLTADAHAVTILDVSGTDLNWGTIQSLQGIDSFVNLQELNCNFNVLDSLDVSNNTLLTKLECKKNQLSHLNVMANTALTYLLCQYNQLSTLDVSNNSALTLLYCHENQLSSLDVSNNSALSHLFCYNNQISTLDVTNNTALTHLVCANNQISTLDLSYNSALTYVGCSSNQISSLDISNNSALTYLNCSNNQINALDVSNNSALTHLICSSNQISSLDISNNSALTYVVCSDNQISALDVSNNTALTLLYCHENQLSSLDVSNNSALTYLACANNQISTLDLSYNTALARLICHGNQLTELNVRNGNNSMIANNDFQAQLNPNLRCIQVDDVAYSEANWFYKDASSFYSENCEANIYGFTINDLNQNCTKDNNEIGVGNRLLYLQPGNIILSAYASGLWQIDSLPSGNYTITADTSDEWSASCSPTVSFTVVHPDSLLEVADILLYTDHPCTAPDISMCAPFLRPGFSNQNIYVQACNQHTASGIMDSAWVLVELDPLLHVDTASLPYVDLGNNQYSVYVGTIYPGQCHHFALRCSLSTAAVLNSTLCMEATLYPVDSCALDNTPNPYPDSTVSPCNLPWDRSSLMVEGACVNDSIRFVIYNTGNPGGGDMDCFAPVRIYIDGQFYLLDSIQLAGGDSIVFMFEGDGRTWRLEADQHPLHPGNSHPNASVENCGSGTWTPNLINSMPLDDADPVKDIFCGIVRGSYDPNDKRGFPLGVGSSNDILPGQDIEYVIRFQNTGTDTAFTVVIRDTLSTDLDIFSVVSGVSSHDYSFKMYGQRVLEWTFNNIMLPDSNVNEPASNGFVTFKVDQAANLPLGTVIENSAAIYFDFNAPIITNTSIHTVNERFVVLDMDQISTQEMQLNVYPNPTNSWLHIERNNTDAIQISLHDNLGRCLLSKKSNQSLTQLDLSDLMPGVYYLSVKEGKKQTSFKVLRR